MALTNASTSSVSVSRSAQRCGRATPGRWRGDANRRDRNRYWRHSRAHRRLPRRIPAVRRRPARSAHSGIVAFDAAVGRSACRARAGVASVSRRPSHRLALGLAAPASCADRLGHAQSQLVGGRHLPSVPRGKSPAPAISFASATPRSRSTSECFRARRADTHREKPRSCRSMSNALSALVLSHAHIDHSGRLPMLARDGYKGPIYATPATRDLCAIMLADSAHIQEKDADYLARKHRPFEPPLYGQKDVVDIMERIVCFPYDRPFDVAPGVRATFVDAGHILGSASVILECTEGELAAPARLLRRRRTMGTSDHPRSQAARRRGRRHHGVDVRRSRPRVRCRDAERARENRSRDGGAWWTRFHSGVRRRSHAGVGLRSSSARARRTNSGDPDRHRQPARDRRDLRLRDASRDLRQGRRARQRQYKISFTSTSSNTRATSPRRKRSTIETDR